MPFDKDDLDRLSRKDPTLTHIKAPSNELGELIGIDDIKALLAAAKDNPFFTSLTLSEQHISEEGMALIAQLPLKKLTLISDGHFSAFKNNNTIGELDISANKAITDDAINIIATRSALIYLAADNNAIENNAAILANHANLRYLNLSGNQLGHVAVEKLLANPNFISLDLRANQFDASFKNAVRQRANLNPFNQYGESAPKTSLLFQPAPSIPPAQAVQPASETTSDSSIPATAKKKRNGPGCNLL